MDKIIVLGSSTGGPSTLESIFKQIPKKFPVPIIVAQHLYGEFTKDLARRLDNVSKNNISVSEAKSGDNVKSGHAYLIPGDSHFFIQNPGHKISLITADTAPIPSVDMGLTSVAEHYGPGTIAVILTGMGKDGVLGSKAVKQVHGYVIAQDEWTSKSFGMPKAVIDAKLANEILPLGRIVERLIELTS